MDKNQETWSKERILAEMEGLEKSAGVYLALGLSLFLPGIGIIGAGIINIRFMASFSSFLLLFGLLFTVGGIFLFKKYFKIRRKYNELKGRL